MPKWKCPNCDAELREEETCVYESPQWLHQMLTISIACWACSWSAEWAATNVIEEKEEVKG